MRRSFSSSAVGLKVTCLMMAVGDAEVVEAAVGRSVVLTVGMTTMGEGGVVVSGTAGSRAGGDGAVDEMG